MNMTAALSNHRNHRPFGTLALITTGLLCALLAGTAHADANSAASYMFANNDRAGASFGISPADIVGEPTLVRGMYAVYTRRGQFVSFTNESGTLTGDRRGMKVISSSGLPRPMTADELAGYRAEVMANIDYDRLIKVGYGNGGGRKLLMFSALDCGFCKRMEDGLAKNSKKLDTTFYVMPGTLRGANEGGLPLLQSISQIWCSPNSGAAWQSYWAQRPLPAARQCGITPKSIERDEAALKDLLFSAGVSIKGYPTVVDETGEYVSHQNYLDAASVNAVFGANARPQIAQQPAYWIVSAAEASAQQQTAAAHAPVQQQALQQNGKINTKDLLKKLFK